jgi:uncharacterized protein (DUF58 family)
MRVTELTEDLQVHFKQIEIFVRQRVSDLFSGEFRSYFKGTGIEFEDVREYVYGDDVRSMDWNVTARSGKPHVRQFMDRREMSLYFLVDVSASSFFGSAAYEKREQFVRIFALLAAAATHKQNNVGLIAYSDQVELVRKSMKGQRNAFQMARELLLLEPKGKGTSLRNALDELMHIRKQRSVVIVLSDFWDDGYEKNLQLANHLHDIIFIRVNDPREYQLPSKGAFEVADMETGERMLVDFSSVAQRTSIEETLLEKRQILKNNTHKCGIDLLEINSADDFVEQLRHFFEVRKDNIANG